jgi:hypothetical protein
MRMTRREIIDQALQRSGNNTDSLRRQARIKLNRILQDLYLQWDWPFLWRRASLVIPPNGVFPLPDDFLKAEDDHALVVETVGDTRYQLPLQEVDHLTFTQLARPGAEGTLPRVWTVDYAAIPKAGMAWPRPFFAAACSLRYKFLPPDIPASKTDPTPPYDDDIPTFPWDAYLSDAVLQWAMEYEADPRANDQLMKNREQLGLIRGATWPERSYRSTIPLDPVFFGTPFRSE